MTGDGFVVDGKLAFVCCGDENSDDDFNGIVPVGQTVPFCQRRISLDSARLELDRLASLLQLKDGALNVDFIFDEEGDLFVLELRVETVVPLHLKLRFLPQGST